MIAATVVLLANALVAEQPGASNARPRGAAATQPAPPAAKPAGAPADIVVRPNDLPGQPSHITAIGVVEKQTLTRTNGKQIDQYSLVTANGVKVPLPAPRGRRTHNPHEKTLADYVGARVSIVGHGKETVRGTRTSIQITHISTIEQLSPPATPAAGQ